MTDATKENSNAKEPDGSGRSSIAFWVGLVGAAIIVAESSGTITQNGSHEGRYHLALVSMVLFAGYLILRGTDKGPIFGFRPGQAMRAYSLRWCFALITSATCLWGVHNYYQFDRTKLTELHSYEDATYYYLNSKYFDELGYFSLYPALLLADDEQAADDRLLNEISHYRNLRDYKMAHRSRSREEKDGIKSGFGPKRWETFKHDAHYLIDHWPGGKKYFFTDHGYNPPPTWTIVGGTLSSLVPVENLWWLAMIDFTLVGLMFLLIVRTYGMDTLLFCMLFFLCTYSGRWPMLGESILRFDWMVALVCGVAFLRREKYAVAGACLAYAAWNRIFPAIFFFPVLTVMLFQVYRTRKLAREHLRLITAAAITSLVLVGGALIAYGAGAFEASMENLLLHQSSASFSRYRIGFGDALVYRGELTGEALNKAGGIHAKAKMLAQYKPVVYAAAVVSLGFIVWWSDRGRRGMDLLIPLAIIPLFALTNPQINYFNLRLLLICWHCLDLSRGRNRFGVIALLGIEAMTQYSHVVGNDRYATTSLTSVGLSAYFGLMMLSLALESKFPVAGGDRRPWRSTLIGLAVFGGVYAGYWHSGSEEKATKGVPATELATIRDSGTKWNAPGTRKLRAGQRLLVSFDETQEGSHVDLSFDNNDIYVLTFMSGEQEIAQVRAQKGRNGPKRGLARRQFEIPDEARRRGFDRIKIEAEEGDGYFSIGHLVITDEPETVEETAPTESTPADP